jgi:hypothetical protein
MKISVDKIPKTIVDFLELKLTKIVLLNLLFSNIIGVCIDIQPVVTEQNETIILLFSNTMSLLIR